MKTNTKKMIFQVYPDDIVLNLLSFFDDKSIMNTRMWQSERVKHCTEELTFLNAIEFSNLDNLKWLYQVKRNGTFRIDQKHCMLLAARNGKLNIMKWLHANKTPSLSSLVFREAALFGSLENLKWLYEKQCPWNEWTFRDAAKFGSLDNIKWLYKNKCPWDEYTLRVAIKNGSLEIVIWLLDKQCPRPWFGLHVAAQNGHSEIIKWLTGNDFPGVFSIKKS